MRGKAPDECVGLPWRMDAGKDRRTVRGEIIVDILRPIGLAKGFAQAKATPDTAQTGFAGRRLGWRFQNGYCSVTY